MCGTVLEKAALWVERSVGEVRGETEKAALWVE